MSRPIFILLSALLILSGALIGSGCDRFFDPVNPLPPKPTPTPTLVFYPVSTAVPAPTPTP